MPKTQTIEMVVDREVKHSVLYRPADPAQTNPIFQNIYLMRHFALGCGRPKDAMPAKIRVTVEVLEE